MAKQTLLLSFFHTKKQAKGTDKSLDTVRSSSTNDNHDDDQVNSCINDMKPSHITTDSLQIPEENTEENTEERHMHSNSHENIDNHDSGSDSESGEVSSNDVDKPSETNSKVSSETLGSDDNNLSEYEKLRLRNIKRNHERLVALGLAEPNSLPIMNRDTSSSTVNRKKKRKKVSAPTLPKKNLPVRRSTRNRKSLNLSEVDEANSLEENASQPLEMEQEVQEELEMFEDSPLVQYSMNNTNEDANDTLLLSAHKGPIASLEPVGSRLLSPKAKLALYSLDLYSDDENYPMQWIVGAGKSGIVSIWNIYDKANEDGIESVISFKGHNGRWIADALFVPSQSNTNNNIKGSCPSNLLTAGNDGSVCLWDLKSTASSSGVPKLLAQTGKTLHSSGIFSMHVESKDTNYRDFLVCTGSKDKTICVTSMESICSGRNCTPFFVSNQHTSKVSSVQMNGSQIGSTSDDGSFALHDYRTNKVIFSCDDAHYKPHSFVWEYENRNHFATAGLDNVILVWDRRNLGTPFRKLKGHVPQTTRKHKRIHRPCFLKSDNENQYILSGSEGSGSLALFNFDPESTPDQDITPVYSRGYLPQDCGDAGCSTVQGSNVAVAIDGGDVIILCPSKSDSTP